MKRTAGKSQSQELAKMAENMHLTPQELQQVLKERLEAMDPATEKAEYVDWLLSSSSDKGADVASNGATKQKPTTLTSSNGTSKPASKTSNAQVFHSNVLFSERTDLHPNSKRAITEVMQLTSMTEIQEKTFAAASSGRDVLGRARTGTGCVNTIYPDESCLPAGHPNADYKSNSLPSLGAPLPFQENACLPSSRY